MENEEFLNDLVKSNEIEMTGLLLNLLRSEQISVETRSKYCNLVLEKALELKDVDESFISSLIEIRDMLKDYLHKNRRIKIK